MKKPGEEEKTTGTLVDEYIKQIENLGITLKDLKLLGDIEYKDGDAKLTEKELVEKILTDDSYKEDKERIEKYIGEFIKADLITQSVHKRRGTQLVNPHNDNWIDGGVYLYRTKQSTDISGALKVDGDAEEYIKQMGNEEYVQMQYVTQEEWEELKNSNNKKIRYRYTLDEDGNVVIAKVKTIETVEGDISNSVNTWFEDTLAWTNEKFGVGADSTQVIVEGEEHIDYKEYISKYTMPYEFLLSLCEITGSPEFVYHVAMLARQTEIDLVVQDDSTVEKAISEVEEKYETYENTGSDSTSGASKINEYTTKKRRLTITTTADPHLEIEYANTWSFFEKYLYTKNMEVNVEENGPINERVPLPSTLSKHQEERQVTEIYQGLEEVKTLPERWYDTFLAETTTSTQTTTTVTTYNPGILENSVEKSKQFLGLLRNEDGKCYYDDCYKNPHRAEICAEKAEFVRGGINVGYQKPNSSKDDDKPLNELLNKANMLYGILGENVEGDETANAEEDSASEYKVKMQGLVDHMKYLMTLPDNEDLEIDYEQDEEDEVDVEEPEVKYDDIDEEDLELLYKLCEAEAGGSKSATEIGHVACVVLNRVKCSKWPNTIKEVIYQPNQFACVNDGHLAKAVPSDITKQAVNNIVGGSDTTGGAVYFRTHASADKSKMPLSALDKHPTYIYLFEDPITTHIFYTDQKSLEELRGATGGTSPATGKLADVFPDGIPTTREEIQKYLVTIQVPITTKQGKKTTAPLTIHKDVAESVKGVLQKAQDEGFIVYEVQGFSWRKISGSTKMSQHSLGLAVDINVKENYCVYPNGKVDAGSFWNPERSSYSIPRGGTLYNAFKGIGWGWGGDWSSKKDYMHFSYTGG